MVPSEVLHSTTDECALSAAGGRTKKKILRRKSLAERLSEKAEMVNDAKVLAAILPEPPPFMPSEGKTLQSLLTTCQVRPDAEPYSAKKSRPPHRALCAWDSTPISS